MHPPDPTTGLEDEELYSHQCGLLLCRWRTTFLPAQGTSWLLCGHVCALPDLHPVDCARTVSGLVCLSVGPLRV